MPQTLEIDLSASGPWARLHSRCGLRLTLFSRKIHIDLPVFAYQHPQPSCRTDEVQ